MEFGPTVSNPKRVKRTADPKDGWFDYYAGFSSQFVADTLRFLELSSDARVLDPWNGGGTTTATAYESGINSIGIDLNPVMVIVARARLLSKGVSDSLNPLAEEIIAKSIASYEPDAREEPLINWLVPRSAVSIRKIADAITSILTKESSSLSLYRSDHLSKVSDLAAFYLVALFRTVRQLLKPFQATNPTWMKTPGNCHMRLRPDVHQIRTAFLQNVQTMASAVTHSDTTTCSEIRLACSSALPQDLPKFNAVISSPPYCTRIDYAVATKPELAIIGCPLGMDFRSLRQSLIGGPVVAEIQPIIHASWGEGCLQFLDVVRSHPSKGSKNYYYKLFLQYFGGMQKSLSELDRVLVPGGRSILVVQESHYKSERIDIARYLTEMASKLNWSLEHRFDFETSLLMARMNPRSRKYRSHQSAVESVLWFRAA